MLKVPEKKTICAMDDGHILIRLIINIAMFSAYLQDDSSLISSSITHLFKIWYPEFSKILKDHIIKPSLFFTY